MQQQELQREVLEVIIGTLALHKLLQELEGPGIELSFKTTPDKIAGKSLQLEKDEKTGEIVVSVVEESEKSKEEYVKEEKQFWSAVPLPLLPNVLISTALLQAFEQAGKKEVRFPEQELHELLQEKKRLLPVVSLGYVMLNVADISAPTSAGKTEQN